VCFELWFVLHFEDLGGDYTAENYHQKLKEKLRKENFEYIKNENLGKLFQILIKNIEKAIENAKKIDTNDFTKNPSTKIWEIISKIRT